MEQLYVYFYCDEWKSTDSMSFVGVFEESILKQMIIEDVKRNDVAVDDRDEEEIRAMDMYTLNSLLEYGYFQAVTINERA